MIEINNLTTASIKKNFLRKTVKEVLRGEGIKKEVELSIALIGPIRMREINKRYRRKNKVTDVLSFPESKKIKMSLAKKTQNLGEIIICPQQVKKNAKRYTTNFKTELTRVLIHGVLSLLGYEYEKSEKEAKKMEEKQQYYFSQI